MPDKLPLGSRVTLVANTHRAVIRIAELPVGRLSKQVQWRLVEENFPMGPLLNADTHIFDGSVFENNAGRRCFMMAALPKAFAEPVGDMAVAKWGSKLARMDTVEHLLFRRFVFTHEMKSKRLCKTENPMPMWVVFPQDIGFRVLHINDGLPRGAYYISNHPPLREAELVRVWEVAEPSHVVMLARRPDAGGGVPQGVETNAEELDLEELTSEEVCKDLWLREFVQGKGLVVENRELCCMASLL